MKNKPLRHKEENTFKFKKFADRISEIDVDVFHRVAHKNEINEDEDSLETNFNRALQKWNVLNLTEGYTSFKKEVRHVVTLPQLINHKEEVINSLSKYLAMKDVAFVQPILDLVVAAAKDLQQDFYEYFPHFLSLIIDLFATKDPDIMEYSFTTLAYLFKFLWRYFIKNIDRTFDLLLPLLVDSKPDYVNNFAAESFAFVARKVRDRKAFLKLVFDALEKNPSGIVGCGKLLFEVVSGTTGQFHSCAEDMLEMYLNSLTVEENREKLAYDVVEQIFICITNSIRAEHSKVLWDVLLKFLPQHQQDQPGNLRNRKIEQVRSLSIDENVRLIKPVLKLIRLVVEHRGGVMLLDPVEIKSRITKIILQFEAHEDVLRETVDLSVSILLAKNVKVSQETSRELIKKLLSIRQKKTLIHVIERLINHTSFETLILPTALRESFLREEFGDNELRLFAKIVTTRSPHSLQGSSLKNWRKINIDLRGFSTEIYNFLREKLDTVNYNSEDALKTIMILPHLTPLNSELIGAVKKILIWNYEKLCLIVEEDFSPTEIIQKGFTFLLALESLIHILDTDEFQILMENSKIDFVELGKKCSSFPSILDSIDLFFSYMAESEFKNKYINMEIFDEINGFLVERLTSPYRRIRLTTCHIYSLFNKVEGIFEENEEKGDTLEKLYLAENTDVSVQTYRDRLIHIQSLSFGTKSTKNLCEKYLDIPLRFLMGNLYINFSLLWNPVMKAIATFANENCPQFWPIFLEELKKQPQTSTTIENNRKEFFSSFTCDVLKALSEKFAANDKPDHQNYTILLWKSMNEFPEYCEMKNRDVTVLFIDFVENNFFKSNLETGKSCSIQKKSEINETIEEEDIEDEEEEKSKETPMKKMGKSSKMKLLLAQLKVFSKVQNPRTLYRESEINKIYMELLTSKNGELQKAALDCLSTYKHKFLTPYKDHLYGLIDEKNLRNELARFKVADEENSNGTIEADHRDSLMPILMRIIYAKIISRGSGRSGGGEGGKTRRETILRFLMGVREEEMMIFAKMAFKIFEKFQISLSSEIELRDLRELTMELMQNLDLNDVIPPKRLTSAVNLLETVIEKFGAKMSSNLLPRLLAILISVLAHVKGILDRSENVLSGFISMIKDLRTNCIKALARFFNHFENYKWTTSELDALFDVGVFPWLEKLPIEGIHSPTALLKLFHAWSKNPRYFCLLVKHKEGDINKNPLQFIMKLFLGKKTHSTVINTILEMLEKLLTIQDYGIPSEDQMETEETSEIIPLTPTNVSILPNQISATIPGSNIHLNYGSAILISHVPDILKFIEEKFQRSKSGINRTETIILARISELDLDPETSNSLVSLSLPIVVKRASKGESEETILELLSTITNLMKNVEEPQTHLRKILPLLSSVSSSGARKVLLKLLESIASRTTECSEIPREVLVKNSKLLSELNANDQRWIDQPDFERRLSAFEKISLLAKSDDKEELKELTLELGVGILHCCYYFLRHEKDQSLRERSGDCLNFLGPKLAKLYQENPTDRLFLVEGTILNLVKGGILSKNESARLGSISFLGSMSMECPDVHPVFRDLNLLTDRVDREVDFFENLQHLQLNRKARAFLKFVSISKTLTRKPNTKTLMEFIFPLASSYLCNESFHNKNSLIDASIETIGAVCRLLSWNQYSVILKYYLNKLRSSTDFQKQIIRIVIAILDAFHYDLSKLKKVEEIVAKPLEEENDLEKAEEENDLEKPEEEKEDAEEKLQEDLAQATEETDQEEKNEIKEADEENPIQGQLVVEKQTILSQSAAKKLVFDITKTIIPHLHRSILARTQHELSHKVNRRKTGAEKEDEELMRVPIALAVVKLLQKLPGSILNKNLPGIFMKLCTFLKSRLDSVRRTTRETLQQIMITLGPDYLHHLLREMNSLLTKGFHIHVLAYTIHAVLISLKPYFKENHINENLQSIWAVCRVDLFGLSAEEKEVSAVIKNTSEARSTKSFDIFHVMAQFITESSLLDLVQPLVDILNETRSHKIVRKVVECFRHVVLGLADNALIQSESMLIFLYGIVSKSIPSFSKTSEGEKSVKKDEKREKVDSFIIQPEPKSRKGIKAMSKTSGNTNDHVILEFGLKLLHILLKRDKISGKNYKAYLDPFVPILANSLETQHVKLSSLALQCLNWVLKIDLQSVKTSVKQICDTVFKILHKYGAAGLGKGDNFDLVMAAFKTMSVLVRDVKHFDMTPDQTKALILYAEQDLHDYDRQATAFNLIRAIINRKIVVTEIHSVMNKVAILSVTSESDNTRQQARAVFYTFLMEYPLGELLEQHLSFYLTQLSYEMQPGRMSALDMIQGIVNGFPEKILIEQSGLLFVMVGARLVNDEDPNCRKLCAKIIKDTITKVPHNHRVKLFDIVLTWFKDSNVSHRRLAAQLCGIFVTVEKESFESRLSTILPLVLKQFHAESEEDQSGKFVRRRPKKKPQKNDNIKDPERMRDHHVFQVLQLTLKISANCPAFLKNNKWIDQVQSLAEQSQELLAHPHLWVRLAATQQIGFILATLDEEKVLKLLSANETAENSVEEKGYVYKNPVETLRSLSLDLVAQLQPGMEFEELADQVVKNLVFIARVIKSSTYIKDEEKNQAENNGISVLWLLRRLRKCVNVEVTQNPKSTSVRNAAFKWTAGVIATIPIDPYLRPILFQIMSPLVREMVTTEEANAPLRQLSKEVGRMIKKRIGDEDYTRLLAKVQQKLDIRRTDRKRTRTQAFVIDPELAAKRKIAKQQKKKEAKKRKKTESHGKKFKAKRPRKEIDMEVT